jgi:Zn-dependent M28 family amino/carboxypeptidase
MSSSAVTATLRLARRLTRQPLINVVGVAGPRAPEAVVVTAHLDHIGATRGDAGDLQIAPGAVDNASGVAALVELARRLARRPHTTRMIVFAATDAEEAGLVGSALLVSRLRAAGIGVVANINIDGATLMQHPLAEVVVLGGQDSTLGRVASSAAADSNLDVQQAATPIGGSDHYPFALAGIPAIWVVAGPKSGLPGVDGQQLQDRWMADVYHTQRDTMDQPLNFVAAAKLVDVLESILSRLTRRGAPTPSWSADAYWAGRRQ